MVKKDSDLLSGTFPVIPTPFREDGKSIDYSSLNNVVRYLLDCNVDGVVFPGLASEYAQLSEKERLEATKKIGELINDKVPFIVGAGASTPEEAIKYAVSGAEAGAVCAMVMAPAVYADDPIGMQNFYSSLAQEAQIPIMLQNAPQPMGAGLPVEDVLELVNKVPAITYVKEETMPAGQRIEYLLKNAPVYLKGVFGGAGGRYILEELACGALGTVPASELTEVHVELVNAYRSGDEARARQLFVNMLPILNMQAIFRCSLTKYVLKKRNIVNNNVVRVPGPEMGAREKIELEKLWPLVVDQMGSLNS